MFLILVSGAVAGVIHVLSGPDHLTAVAPLALSDGRRGWLAGLSWGFGHASGVVCVAVLAVVLRAWLPPVDLLSAWGERLVGVALIFVGLWALRRGLAIRTTPHQHEGHVHRHMHVGHGPSWMQRLGHAHASFYMGILHGVAGSSHFFGVLPALALPSLAASLIYISAFGVGTVAAMSAFAAGIAAAGVHIGDIARSQSRLMVASSIAALAVGVFWLLG